MRSITGRMTVVMYFKTERGKVTVKVIEKVTVEVSELTVKGNTTQLTGVKMFAEAMEMLVILITIVRSKPERLLKVKATVKECPKRKTIVSWPFEVIGRFKHCF